MTRGTVPGLATPHPLGALLPAVYQDDEFAMRFTAGLDEVLAPVLSTLDNLAAYVDPRHAPDDFLDWLGGWVGVTLRPDWPEDRRRTVLASATELFRWRGTPAGIQAHLETVTGTRVEVRDSGGVTGAVKPGGPLPGDARPWLVVRIPAHADRHLVEEVLAAVAPAHVPHRVEVVDDDRLS